MTKNTKMTSSVEKNDVVTSCVTEPSEWNNLYRLIKNKSNVLLTGGAGVGKTYVLNKLLDRIDRDNKAVLEHNKLPENKNNQKELYKIARLATTGIAATHINGVTLDSFFHLRGCSNMRKLFMINMNKCMEAIDSFDCFIFDEVSMLRSDKFEVLVFLFRRFFNYKIDSLKNNMFEIKSGFITVPPKEKNNILKGMQEELNELESIDSSPLNFQEKAIIFSGDFMQIPPVVKKNEEFIKIPDINKWMKFNPWIYNSDAWENCQFETILLTEVKRQDNADFSKVLNMIRLSKVSMRGDKALKARNFDSYEDVLVKLTEEGKSIPPILCPTNVMVSKYNEKLLEEKEGDSISLKGHFNWHPTLEKDDHLDLIHSALKNTLMEREITLKEDARVMFLVNDKDGRFFNGTVGIYKYRAITFDSHEPKYSIIQDFFDEMIEQEELDFKYTYFDGRYIVKFKEELIKKLKIRYVHYHERYKEINSRNIKYEVTYKKDDKGKLITRAGKPIVDDYVYNFGTKSLIIDLSNDLEKQELICCNKVGYYHDEGKRAENEYETIPYDILFSQYPVKLAYSVTFHKSQGMTMKSLIVDFNSKFIGQGAVYVALSRVESIDNLYLIGWSKNRVRACGDGIRFYKQLEAKQQRENEIREKNLIEEARIMKEYEEDQNKILKENDSCKGGVLKDMREHLANLEKTDEMNINDCV